MSINNLGHYELPLSEEERVKIIPIVQARITRDVTDTVRDMVRKASQEAYHMSIGHFSSFNPEAMVKVIQERFDRCFDKLRSDHPGIAELNNLENLKFEITFDPDQIPIINPAAWLKSMLQGSGTITLDMSHTKDANLVGAWKRESWSNESLIDDNVPEEMIGIVNFNRKLNDIVEDYEYDFTDIIKDIIQAVKEGKL